MALTKFYLKRTSTTVSGTLVGTTATVSATTPTYIGAAGNLSEEMNGVISTAAQTSLTLAIPGNTTVPRSGLIARWYSSPIAGQTIGSQTITVSIAVQENNLDSNYQFTWVLAVWRPSNGTLVGRVWDQLSAAAEPPSTSFAAVTVGTGGSSTSVTCEFGDVLVLEAWRASSVTGATNTRNNLVGYDGTTEGGATNNAAYIEFANAIAFYDTGDAALSASLSLTASGSPLTSGSAPLSALSALSAAGDIVAPIITGSASLSSSMSMSVLSKVLIAGSSTLASSLSLTAAWSVATVSGSAVLISDASLNAACRLVRRSSVSLTSRAAFNEILFNIIEGKRFRGPTYVMKGSDELWFVGQSVGVTVVKRQDGSWFETVSPVDSELQAAARVYRGGYTYPLSDADAAELTAAGYGAYIS